MLNYIKKDTNIGSVALMQNFGNFQKLKPH